jgi:hypothetical protein
MSRPGRPLLLSPSPRFPCVLSASAVKFFAILLASTTLTAGPAEFGTAELDRAIAERGLNPRLFRIKTEVAVDPPESFRIAPNLITGGDLRGVMYGLLDASDQIRATGRLRKASGAPALAMRGVRMMLKDLDADSLRSRDFWPELFKRLARNRFNRFNLVLPRLPDDTDMLHLISQTAADYGVDFALGLWGDSEGQPGPDMEAALAKLLSACPSIRSVQLRMQSETAMYAVQALHEAGRRLTLEAAADAAEVSAAAASAGVPMRVSAAYPDGKRPDTRLPFYWEVAPQSARDAKAVIGSLVSSGATGFEIDLPTTGADSVMSWGRLGYDPGAK